MEVSGGYEKAFVHYLLNPTIKVAVVNAKRVRDLLSDCDCLHEKIINLFERFA